MVHTALAVMLFGSLPVQASPTYSQTMHVIRDTNICADGAWPRCVLINARDDPVLAGTEVLTFSRDFIRGCDFITTHARKGVPVSGCVPFGIVVP